MKKNKILVTGGAGYIGQSLIRAIFKNSDFHPVIIDSYLNKNADADNIFLNSMNDPMQIAFLLKKEDIRIVIHLAAYSSVAESTANPTKYYKNNIMTTVNLLNAMKIADVKKIVFASSSAVYGKQFQIQISETHPQQPINPYGWTKLVCEQMIEDCAAAWGLEYIILRPFSVCGANQTTAHLIATAVNTAKLLKQKQKAYFSILGGQCETKDGTPVRDFVHVEDVAQAFALACWFIDTDKFEKNMAYNVCNGTGTSVLDIINIINQITDVYIPYEFNDPRPGDPDKIVGNPAAIKKHLCWVPKYPNIKDIVHSVIERNF